MSGLLLAGDLYLDRLTSGGVAQGYLDAINCTKLALSQPDPTKITRVSNMRATLGQNLDVVQIANAPEIAIDIDDAPADILAMALLGTVLTLTASSATGTAWNTTAKLGKWVYVGRKGLSALTVTGKTLGTDYAVDLAGGLVKALAGGTIADNAAIAGTYDAAALSGSKITGLTNQTTLLKLLLIGTNLANGKAVRLEVDQAVVSPTGEIDLLGRKYVTTSLKGELKTVSGAGEPFRYEEW